MVVYLTKFALLEGVKKVEVEKCKDANIYYERINQYSSHGYLRNDFCLTFEEARLKVRKIIDIEISRLRGIRPF